MALLKYRARKTVKIEAFQFHGGNVNVRMIMEWIHRHGGTSSYHEAIEAQDSPGGYIPPIPAQLRIENLIGVEYANMGDYIVNDPKIGFTVIPMKEFEESFRID